MTLWEEVIWYVAVATSVIGKVLILGTSVRLMCSNSSLSTWLEMKRLKLAHCGRGAERVSNTARRDIRLLPMILGQCYSRNIS